MAAWDSVWVPFYISWNQVSDGFHLLSLGYQWQREHSPQLKFKWRGQDTSFFPNGWTERGLYPHNAPPGVWNMLKSLTESERGSILSGLFGFVSLCCVATPYGSSNQINYQIRYCLRKLCTLRQVYHSQRCGGASGLIVTIQPYGWSGAQLFIQGLANRSQRMIATSKEIRCNRVEKQKLEEVESEAMPCSRQRLCRTTFQ